MDVIVIVEIQFIAAFVKDAQGAIESRSAAACEQVEDQDLSGFGMETEHIVIRVFADAIDDDRQINLLRMRKVIVRFRLPRRRQ